MSTNMSRFYTKLPLSPAQNAVLNPVGYSSNRAQVISIAKSGFHQNYKGIDVFSCTVEPEEHPGHPMQVTGMASLAKQLSRVKVGDWVALEGTIQGSLSRGRTPYVLISSITEAAPEQD